MKSLFKNRLFISVLSLALGIAGTYYVMKSSSGSVKGGEAELPFIKIDSLFDEFYNDEFFHHAQDPFESLRKMRERLKREWGEGPSGLNFFDDWYKKRFGGGGTEEVTRREDEDFVYYDIAIKDLNKDKLKVEVTNGQVSISGEIKKESGQGSLRSQITSSFYRSFPVPPNVRSDDVQMEESGGRVTLKFPKMK